MTFPAYPDYKDSGVEWLGKVPSHWDVKKFRYFFKESVEKITNEVVGPMLSVSGYRGIEIKKYSDENQIRADEDLVGYRIVRKGQLVVNTMWLNYAGLGVSSYEGHVSPAYRAYDIDSQLEKSFVHFLMRSSLWVIGYTKYLTGIRPNSLQMSRDDLMAFPVLLPTREEQVLIAKFLDYETAKINSLIEEQVRLNELLNEKRQSIISNAVCRGLDSNVRFKDSGVEWLGMIPNHWTVEKIKNNILEISSGVSVNAIDTPALNGEVAVLKTSCVYSGEFDPLENKTVVIDEIERVSCPVTKDTLVVSRMNTPELVGAAGLVREHFQNLFLPDRLWKISFDGLNPAFVHYWTLTNFYRAMVEISCAGTSSSMQNLTQEDFRGFTICFPNLDEQSSIVAHLDIEVNKLDGLINESKSVVNLLNERRSALISAAVTGKIDVRKLHGN